MNESGNNLVINENQNSEVHFQALFDSVLNPNSRQTQQLPWSMRKLPDSFFKPPSTGSKTTYTFTKHRFESSTKSTVSSTQSSLEPYHQRAHSSPASLQQICPVSRQPSSENHIRQRSYNLADKATVSHPLPRGWEKTCTSEGRVYYFNRKTRVSTWNDPRKYLGVEQTLQMHQSSYQSEVSSDIGLVPLPEGWEQAQTPAGETYFINHHNCTTTWIDPRFKHLQQQGKGSQCQEYEYVQEKMENSPDSSCKLTSLSPLLTSLNSYYSEKPYSGGVFSSKSKEIADNETINNRGKELKKGDEIIAIDQIEATLQVNEEFPYEDNLQSILNPSVISKNEYAW